MAETEDRGCTRVEPFLELVLADGHGRHGLRVIDVVPVSLIRILVFFPGRDFELVEFFESVEVAVRVLPYA